MTSKLPENGFGDPRTVQKDGGRVLSYHSGNAKTNRGARRYEKTIITNVCFHRFLPILWTQTGITAMVGAPNAQKLPMFLRLILIKFIVMSRTLREEWRALIIRPLICISLNKNSDYWYIPHSLKHTDTYKWPCIREF